MVFGVGLVNEEKTAKAAQSFITLNFYDENKISSTSGTTLSSSNVLNFGTLSTNDKITNTVLTSVSNSGTVQYGKNGGLTLGTGSKTASTTFTFADDYAITKVELIGTLYDNGSNFKLNSTTAESGSLNAKGTKLSDASSVLKWTLDTATTSLKFETTAKRATIYQLKLYYGEVDPNESNITLDQSAAILKVDDSLTLNAETSGTGTTVTWTSSVDGIVEINEGWEIKAKAISSTFSS